MMLRPAAPEDSRALAELIYLADKAHYFTSGYEFSLGANPLSTLAKLTSAPARSQFHYSHFDVAVERSGAHAAAAVAGFDRASASEQAGDALLQIGWTPEQIQALVERVTPLAEDFPEEPPNTWTIEHVATFPQYRGQGLIKRLLAKSLHRAARQGFATASVDVFEGNHRALSIYEAAGFRPVATFGHEPLRRILNRDPLIRLTRLI